MATTERCLDSREAILPLRRDGNGRLAVGKFTLGDRVRILAAKDIEGVLVEHRRFIDGSERWCVEYWHDAQKREVTVEARELDRVIE